MPSKKALFIVHSSPLPHGETEVPDGDLTPGELEIKTHLGSAYLGYKVQVKGFGDVEADTDASALDVRDKDLVIISSTVKQYAERVCAQFRDVAVPVIVSSKELYDCMGMCGPTEGTDFGDAKDQVKVEIIHDNHPMMAGLNGVVEFCGAEMDFCWVSAPSSVVSIAALQKEKTTNPAQEEKRKVVLFGLRIDTEMLGTATAPPPRFPARRVGFPFDYEYTQTAELKGKFKFWELFDAAVNWAVGQTNIRQFEEVFKEEWQEIYERRIKHYGADPKNLAVGIDGKHAPENLVGLSLSGGGIRSATFSLGVLQGLQELKLLRLFDYLSTVSGGGYLGGWWSAWLSRDGEDQKASIFPQPESIEPDRLEDYRWRTRSARRVAEGSLSAGKDPLHHLRLFANYLTPRKGGLSSDTWRAVSFITRNLLMTWLILLPIVLAFVIVGQSYFMMQPAARQEFFHPYWFELKGEVEKRENEAKSIADDAERKKFDQRTEEILGGMRDEYAKAMRKRALLIGLPLLPLAGWIGLMFLAYMRSNAALPVLVKVWDVVFSNRSRKINWKLRVITLAHLIGGLSVCVLVFYLVLLSSPPLASSTGEWLARMKDLFMQYKWWVIGWAVIGSALMLYTLPWRTLEGQSEDNNIEDELRRGVWRNRIIGVHSKLLVALCLLAVVLVFAAFGHEIFDYLLRDPRPKKMFLDYVMKIGGWGVFAATIFGTIFTALKSAPSGGHDSGEAKQPPAWHRFIFAATPLLVIITLMIVAAWTAHEISWHLTASEYPWPLTTITFIGITLSLFFALFEINDWITKRLLPVASLCIAASLLIIGAAVIYYFYWLRGDALTPEFEVGLLRLAVVVGGLLLFRFMLRGDRWKGGWQRFEMWLRKETPGNKSREEEDKEKAAKRNAVLIIGGIILLLVAVGWRLVGLLGPPVSEHTALTLAASSGIALCGVYVLIEVFFAAGNNRRSLVLLASAYLVLVALLLISFFNDSTTRFQYVSLGMVAGTMTWVIALGWMADPNALSMHSFYTGRLVRAYLGASNPQRIGQKYEITETIVGDDVLLSDLKNCVQGAPYHLLNTTLNLTGGRDLTTAQRSSAMFVLSKLYCGSFRTGYQRSTGYMDGRLSLGTAVATSGAAVSPGMGSGKTTASLAMLMTLLNVRLGFWAPTPSGGKWQSPQARLWPFYTLREFLSQTNDLSSYCYLTDGGHFDNLGLYSLVERGCRYIVIVDAVADSEPCFSDLGNVIRRCRIDFNADIDLDITPFIKASKDDKFATAHFIAGQITYSEKHVRKLGWKKRDDKEELTKEERTGVIIYIKPSLLKNEKGMRADVRQYGIEKSDFPHQSTVDQWFDEAQFESYRRLGQHCIFKAFEKIEEDPNKKRREKLAEQLDAALSVAERNELVELQKESEMIERIKEDRKSVEKNKLSEKDKLSTEFVKGIFDFIYRQQARADKDSAEQPRIYLGGASNITFSGTGSGSNA
jgi:hypothetical protein